MTPIILRVALPVPLRRTFDYIAPQTVPVAALVPGIRVKVPFGKHRQRVGLLLETATETDFDRDRLKPAQAILDEEPLFPAAHLEFLRWAADYYQHPIGEVLFSALPVHLRSGRAAAIQDGDRMWRLTAAGATAAAPPRAPRQAQLLRVLHDHPGGVWESELRAAQDIPRAAIRTLAERGWIESAAPGTGIPAVPARAIRLNDQQQTAVARISASRGTFQPILLNGITGSGKTEVYLRAIADVVAAGEQALVMVPEISLTPQFISRIRESVAATLVVLHSGLSESERLKAWLMARNGDAAIVLGTRSSVWTPLRKPGLFIVDEEHDASYKQQEGFRYSARDLAIVRARDIGVPVVLGSATPSMETLRNVRLERYQQVRLPERAGRAKPPSVRIIDVRGRQMDGALSAALLDAIGTELSAQRQVLLFLNRRGYSPVLMCHGCGWINECRRCDIPLTYHKRRDTLLCHHCGIQTRPPRACPDCGADEMVRIGHGTERLAETLAGRFPGAHVLRIDRDSTRRKGEMGRMVESIRAGEADILIGTQMLAKGHDFPGVTLVGIIDADRGLFSADFRAAERMAQLFIQVSGRAGRAEHPGNVLIQTHYPDHPLLVSLVQHGYDSFADVTLEERRQAGLPPFSYLALLRAEHYEAASPVRFLQEAKDLLGAGDIRVYGPVPAPVEMRAGRLRFQLLLESEQRAALGTRLHPWVQKLESLQSGKKVRWSLDIDPQEML